MTTPSRKVSASRMTAFRRTIISGHVRAVPRSGWCGPAGFAISEKMCGSTPRSGRAPAGSSNPDSSPGGSVGCRPTRFFSCDSGQRPRARRRLGRQIWAREQYWTFHRRDRRQNSAGSDCHSACPGFLCQKCRLDFSVFDQRADGVTGVSGQVALQFDPEAPPRWRIQGDGSPSTA